MVPLWALWRKGINCWPSSDAPPGQRLLDWTYCIRFQFHNRSCYSYIVFDWSFFSHPPTLFQILSGIVAGRFSSLLYSLFLFFRFIEINFSLGHKTNCIVVSLFLGPSDQNTSTRLSTSTTFKFQIEHIPIILTPSRCLPTNTENLEKRLVW